MPEALVHNTFVVTRSFAKPPQRVFAAFADPVVKRRWYAEGPAHEVQAFEMDFRTGGHERHIYRFHDHTPIAGAILENTSSYLDIVPDARIVLAQAMSLKGAPMSAALITLEFVATEAGTDLVCTHQALFYEASDGPERREGGWRALFDRLASEILASELLASEILASEL